MAEPKQLSLFESDEALSRHTSLQKAISPFLAYLHGEGKSHNTVRSFRSDMNLLCEFMGDDTTIGTINTKRLQEFLQWLEYGRGIPCSRKSYARRVTTLKVFFKWLHEIKVLADDPAAAILQRSGPAPLQTIVSPTDIERLLAHANLMRTGKKPDSRPYLLLTLLLDTGIKKSETVRLTMESIENRDTDSPNLLIQYARQNVFKERRLPISHEWLTVLDEYLAQYKPKDNRIFDCTARNLEYVLTDLAKDAGVATKVSFETMRWTSAVRDYQNGIDMENLREKMGLSEISWRETSQKIIKLATTQGENN